MQAVNPRTASGTAVGNLILNAFNHQVFDLNNMDVQHMQVYDTITLAAAASVSANSVNFFSSVGSQSGKTVAQTNMKSPNQLQTPQSFSIMSFRLRISETILLADLVSLMNGFALEFYIGQKVYQQAPLWLFAPGGGIYGVTTVASTSILNNGYPSREGMNRINIPLVIDNTAQFNGNFQGTPFTLAAGGAGGTGLTTQLVLDGFYARGIQ